MELSLEVELKKTPNGQPYFFLPRTFLNTSYCSAFKDGKALVIGKRYKLTIEEVK